MDPISLIKTAWSDPQARILFPGMLLLSGFALAYFPATSGRLICYQGMCLQQQIAAFGTVTESVSFPSAAIDTVRIDRNAQRQTTRVVIETSSGSFPLTKAYSQGQRVNEYAASETERFLGTDLQGHFAVAVSVSGPQSFFRPLALAFMLSGAGLAGWVLRTMPLPGRWSKR